MLLLLLWPWLEETDEEEEKFTVPLRRGGLLLLLLLLLLRVMYRGTEIGVRGCKSGAVIDSVRRKSATA